MMTCERFRELEGRKLTDLTRAERASAMRHVITCRDCDEWGAQNYLARVAEMSETERARYEALNDRLFEEDRQDAEFLAVVNGV